MSGAVSLRSSREGLFHIVKLSKRMLLQALRVGMQQDPPSGG
jgi:hypothetical protein